MFASPLRSSPAPIRRSTFNCRSLTESHRRISHPPFEPSNSCHCPTTSVVEYSTWSAHRRSAGKPSTTALGLGRAARLPRPPPSGECGAAHPGSIRKAASDRSRPTGTGRPGPGRHVRTDIPERIPRRRARRERATRGPDRPAPTPGPGGHPATSSSATPASSSPARSHGVAAHLELFPVNTHVFHLFWSFLPEAGSRSAEQPRAVLVNAPFARSKPVALRR